MKTLTTSSRPPSLILTIWVSSAIAKERRLFCMPKLSLISGGRVELGLKEAMFRITVRLAFLTATVLALPSYAADKSQVSRGEYLVTIGGCNDCHTPGYFFGKPDTERFLGGSDVGFEIPGLGVFPGPQYYA